MNGFRFCFPVFLLLLSLRETCYLYSCQARWQECQKKLGLPLFVLVINNIYSILKRAATPNVILTDRNRFGCYENH